LNENVVWILPSFVYHYFRPELDACLKSLLWLLDIWYWLGM